jgi:hypothetical protein
VRAFSESRVIRRRQKEDHINNSGGGIDMRSITVRKSIISSFVCVAFVLTVSGFASAHAPAPVRAEVWSAEERLFAIDNARGEVVVVDLPDGQVVNRIPVPPKTMMIGRTDDGAYVLAVRGRDTDRQYVTVIASGVEADGMRRPYVAKTLLLGQSVGGIHGTHVPELWGKLYLVVEQEGKLVRFDRAGLAPEAAFTTDVLPLGRPDHVDPHEMGQYVWAGGIRQGLVKLLDQQGRSVATFPCKNLHGVAVDKKTGRSFFGCLDCVLVVEDQKEKTRLKYSIDERVANFMTGNGAYIGAGEGSKHVQVVDPEKLTLKAVPLEGTLVTRVAAEDGKHIFLLLKNGNLEVRDGRTAELIRSIKVTTPFPPMEEDVRGAILPNICVWEGRAYVSLPQWGMIAEVDWVKGKLLRNVMVGGSPSRLLIIEAQGHGTAQ